MKFSTTLATASSLIASAYAAPAIRARVDDTTSSSNSSMSLNGTVNLAQSGSKGAAYFITNDPSGNYIVSANINGDGSLTLTNAVSTGGLGEHGNVTGADPLYSQGAIVVNSKTNMLATVNAGSNTISLFSIDPSSPTTLTAVGAPVASGGEFPQSVAFSDAGDKLCALNGGSLDGIQCFWVNATTGLKSVTNTHRWLGLNQSTPATGPAGTASQIIFSEDQKSVYAAVKGNPAINATGFIAAWDVAEDGALSEEFYRITLPPGAALPFSLNYIPGSNGSLLVTDAAVGVDVFDFAQGLDAVSSNRATLAYPIANQSAVCWAAWSNATGSFYVTDFNTGRISELAVDPTTLNMTFIADYYTQENAGLIDLEVASIDGDDYLYVAMGGAAAIQVFSLPAAGQATKLQTVDLSGPAAAVGLPLTGENIQGMAVYVIQ
ncbi:unnamed protein product [Peniophora sp. CBMAI 1063]|nr:unnamed protein product [Peniophora sp. CBMAI 1063]